MEETMTQNQAERFLDGAKEPYRTRCKEILKENTGWEALQQRFLKMIDDYISVETKKPVASNIFQHEAGGQLRIAFPHQLVRGDDRLSGYMQETMEARKRYTDEHLFHGYVDCHEVHHEIETFIYFQQPLYYLGFPGAGMAAKSIVDVAEHTGNWVSGIPDWYNWESSSFVSNWLGTRGVRNYPPYDYQEGNHFRFIDAAMCAWHITKEQKYLDLICDYCNHWCDHIESLADAGAPITCSILPAHAELIERSKAGANIGEKQYEIFYSLVSDNTMYDIAGGLMDAYRVCGVPRFLNAAELLIDQFVEHGRGGRPALRYKAGRWMTLGENENESGSVGDCTFIARLALRHHRLTGSEKYRSVVMDWAKCIDEEAHVYDQMMANVLVAAHYFDGDPAWLSRAYKMALRVWANVEQNDEFHQCAWNSTRQGTKFLMEMLYQPMTGDVEWGTRGNIPQLLIRHVTGGRQKLPQDISFRIWQQARGTYAWEAANTGKDGAAWELHRAKDDSLIAHVTVGAGEKASGIFCAK